MDEFEDANLIPQNIPTNEVYMFSVGVVTFVTENICDIHPSITSYRKNIELIELAHRALIRMPN